jgi:hypothetical protein
MSVETYALVTAFFASHKGFSFFVKGSASWFPCECLLSNGIHFLLLPFFPRFTNLAFVLYYHKMPNYESSMVLILW